MARMGQEFHGRFFKKTDSFQVIANYIINRDLSGYHINSSFYVIIGGAFDERSWKV